MPFQSPSLPELNLASQKNFRPDPLAGSGFPRLPVAGSLPSILLRSCRLLVFAGPWLATRDVRSKGWRLARTFHRAGISHRTAWNAEHLGVVQSALGEVFSFFDEIAAKVSGSNVAAPAER
jgi:hypothetical protein